MLTCKSNTGKKKKKKSAHPTLFENFMLLQYNNIFWGSLEVSAGGQATCKMVPLVSPHSAEPISKIPDVEEHAIGNNIDVQAPEATLMQEHETEIRQIGKSSLECLS